MASMALEGEAPGVVTLGLRAAELLLNSAENGKKSDIEAATAQMERALRRDGWL
jgi:hypothetical protein